MQLLEFRMLEHRSYRRICVLSVYVLPVNREREQWENAGVTTKQNEVRIGGAGG